jgi:hypothetical protein
MPFFGAKKIQVKVMSDNTANLLTLIEQAEKMPKLSDPAEHTGSNEKSQRFQSVCPPTQAGSKTPSHSGFNYRRQIDILDSGNLARCCPGMGLSLLHFS